jgi:hypothetical protein
MNDQRFKLVVLLKETHVYDHEWVVAEDIGKEDTVGITIKVLKVLDKAAQDVRSWAAENQRIIDGAPSAPASREGLTTGYWMCANRVLVNGFCEYGEDDACNDQCVYCGQPEERK